MKVIKNWIDINKKNSTYLLKMNNKENHKIYMHYYTNYNIKNYLLCKLYTQFQNSCRFFNNFIKGKLYIKLKNELYSNNEE